MSEIATVKSKERSFWDRPEGPWGLAIGAVVLAGGIWFLTWFVPMILALGLGILGVMIVWGTIAGLGVLVLTDNPLRQALVLKFQVFCRKFRRSIINEDPIAVRRIIQSKARERLDEVKKLGAPVKASKAAVQASAIKFQEMYDRLASLYSIKQREGAPQDEINEVLSQMGALDKELKDMQSLSRETQVMDDTLNEATRRIKKIVDKAQFEIDLMETKLTAVKAVSSSWKKLRSIFSPSSKEEELRMEAERASEEQYHQELGQIDQCMTEFRDVLKVLNDEDAINAETARRKMGGLRTSVNGLQALPDDSKSMNQVVTPISSAIKLPIPRK